uniref:MCE family protein n=1 Tax=candidate division WOR-3 bacterium TaxID=2052148 RepID=A0A7C4CBM0_UNCW3
MNRSARNLLATLFLLSGVGLAAFALLWLGGRLGMGTRQLALVHFKDVSGLRVGDPVEVLGVTKGRVNGIRLNGDGVEVSVALDRDVSLTTDTRFAIRSVSYLGSDRFLMVVPGNGPPAEPGFTFEGMNQTLDLEAALARLEELLNVVDPTALTDELRQTKDDLMGVVRRSLSGIDTGMVFAALQLQRLAAGIDTITALLDQESSAKRLLTSTELHDEMLQTTRQLRDLLTDVREHPEKYFRVRLFR